MSKATPKNILDMGFTAEQFGDPAGFSEAGGMLQKILDESTLMVQAEIGGAYASAGSGTIESMYIIKAEKYFTAAELYRKLENYELQGIKLARQEKDLSEKSRYLINAERMETQAWKSLGKLTPTSSGSGGIATGVVITDGFAS